MRVKFYASVEPAPSDEKADGYAKKVAAHKNAQNWVARLESAKNDNELKQFVSASLSGKLDKPAMDAVATARFNMALMNQIDSAGSPSDAMKVMTEVNTPERLNAAVVNFGAVVNDISQGYDDQRKLAFDGVMSKLMDSVNMESDSYVSFLKLAKDYGDTYGATVFSLSASVAVEVEKTEAGAESRNVKVGGLAARKYSESRTTRIATGKKSTSSGNGGKRNPVVVTQNGGVNEYASIQKAHTALTGSTTNISWDALVAKIKKQPNGVTQIANGDRVVSF